MRFKYIFFPAIMTVLNILLMMCIAYSNFIHTQQIMSNNLQSDNSINVYFAGENIPTLRNMMLENPQLTVYEKIYEDINEQVWGVAGKCEISNTISLMINGRFFGDNDFFKNKLVAVAGKNILQMRDKIITENEKRFYEFNGKYYEIIGTIDSNISTALDNVVYINLDSLSDSFYHLIIDSNSKEAVDIAFSELQERYNVRAIDENSNFIKRYTLDQHSIKLNNITLIAFF